ncbi:MAG: hypothetical protein KatS3mg111_0407 [Pirellulaceae bacterium]|nr:MAG: hypothetical protein KatS3mg111_0407 [Pirellulaceae bacterium]
MLGKMDPPDPNDSGGARLYQGGPSRWWRLIHALPIGVCPGEEPRERAKLMLFEQKVPYDDFPAHDRALSSGGIASVNRSVRGKHGEQCDGREALFSRDSIPIRLNRAT